MTLPLQLCTISGVGLNTMSFKTHENVFIEHQPLEDLHLYPGHRFWDISLVIESDDQETALTVAWNNRAPVNITLPTGEQITGYIRPNKVFYPRRPTVFPIVILEWIF